MDFCISLILTGPASKFEKVVVRILFVLGTVLLGEKNEPLLGREPSPFALGFFVFALIVAGIYVVVVQAQANIIAPKVMGRAVRLSPVIIMISLIVGARSKSCSGP